MQDPYQALGLTAGAGEAEIRQRYLELVRQHPPERSPQRFAEIRSAYEQLRDPLERMKRELFRPTDPVLADVINSVRSRLQTQRLDVESLLSLGDR